MEDGKQTVSLFEERLVFFCHAGFDKLAPAKAGGQNDMFNCRVNHNFIRRIKMELLIILIIAMFFLLASIRIPAENERIVVIRLGRFFRIVGPGLVLIIPVIDKAIRVKLSDKIPGWQGFSKEQLELEIQKLPEIHFSNQHLH